MNKEMKSRKKAKNSKRIVWKKERNGRTKVIWIHKNYVNIN